MITTSENQTFNLGKKIARQLRGGEVLALNGQLGAGKTVLVKGLAAGLGIKKVITSPTFVLMKVYKLPPAKLTNLPTYQFTNLIHIDCYRVKDWREIEAIGAAEYFGRPDSVVVIEWAEKIKPLLKSLQTIKITIRLKDKKNLRLIQIKNDEKSF